MVMAITITTEARKQRSNKALESAALGTKAALVRRDDARAYFLGILRGCVYDVC